MHNDSYTVNVACLCSKNLINSFQELKSFFTFKMFMIEEKSLETIDKKYNAIIIETNSKKNISLNSINIPIIYIGKKNLPPQSSNPFELIFKMPINIINFNKSVVELCKKYEFNKNSLIKIKDYILDKNERTLNKDNITLKITEKEIHFIHMLHDSKKPLSKNYILEKIWSYSSDTQTHTIETHIYRLRQKIKKHFGDNNFIKNSTEGYSL
tara:strand:+ start:225 stop:857 length:633 start_codon:yes stop_codon:yes gene_type:complete